MVWEVAGCSSGAWLDASPEISTAVATGLSNATSVELADARWLEVSCTGS